MDCSLQGSSVHWILQARLLEWVVMTSSRGNLPNPGIGPLSLGSSVLADGFFTWEKKSVTWEAHEDECYTHECQRWRSISQTFPPPPEMSLLVYRTRTPNEGTITRPVPGVIFSPVLQPSCLLAVKTDNYRLRI